MTLAGRIEAALGSSVAGISRAGGGSLSEVWKVELKDGGRLAAKVAPDAVQEAQMLGEIREAGCPAPEVLAIDGDLLLLSWLEADGHPDDTAWSETGSAIARLHEAVGSNFGWHEDYSFGPVAIPNARSEHWPEFWRDRRLLTDLDQIPSHFGKRIEVLCSDLDDRLPTKPRPSLLHGDLWSGNLLFAATGFSGVIDPASYYGDGEVDLAMLTLFGNPAPAFFDSYGPLASGWRERKPIYQLWPALVHLRLFGTGYASLVDRLLTEAGA